MANVNQTDRGDRKFAEIVPPRLEQLTNRDAPPPQDLGPLEQLLGVWIGRGTGWNMIALPFQNAPAPPAGFRFRVLMNQYDEELQFTFVDDDVPNRGLSRPGNPDFDQFVVTLDYQQKIAQVVAEDRPHSGLAGGAGLPIHHEPGLWLYEKNRRSKDDQIKGDEVSEVELDVARLASILHALLNEIKDLPSKVTTRIGLNHSIRRREANQSSASVASKGKWDRSRFSAVPLFP